MKYQTLGRSYIKVSPIAAGCMRMDSVSRQEADTLIRSALDLGINFFDHSDVYGKEAGLCESIFGSLVTPYLRDKLIIQTKCGIRKGKLVYDFSRENILASVDNSLKRLNTDYLDVLLLHRPDLLADPAEIADAFETLYESGKVRFFGVSNQNVSQMQLLSKYSRYPLVTNQLQVSIAHPHIIAQGMSVNTDKYFATDRDGGVLDYCRYHDITIQAWSPFQYGFFGGVFFDRDRFPELNALLDRLAEKYGVSNTTIATAWILRHPAHMQVVSGTMKPERLAQMCRAAEITLDREDWYALLEEGMKLHP